MGNRPQESLQARAASRWSFASGPWMRLATWSLPLAFLGFFFFYPLGRILGLALSGPLFLLPELRRAAEVLGFTFYQAILSTLLTFLLGLPAALLFSRFDFRGKAVLRALTAVPFMLPTVVVAAAFNAVLGARGMLNLSGSASFRLDPFAAILIAHVFYNTTIVIRILGAALAGLDPRLEAAARSLGADPARVWWHVTLPILRPALLSAALLVFLFDFTSFGVILLLGGSRFATLEVEIYTQATRFLNLPLAGLLAVIQLACTVVVALLYARLNDRARVLLAPRPLADGLRQPGTSGERLFVGVSVFVLTLFFLVPLAALPVRSLFRVEADRGQQTEIQYGFTTDYYRELFVNRRGSVFYVPPIRAALNSLLYAAATVSLSLLIGFPAAWRLARPNRLEKLLDPLIMLPLGASAVMLGLGFILTFGRWLSSPWMVPFVHTLVAFPFVVRALQPAMASIPERLRQAAASLGASPWAVWRTIDLPILRRATLAAATFAFTISLGEFGATLLIARPEFPTLPVAIERFLSQPGGLNYGQAMAMATLLLGLTLAGILLLERWRLPEGREF